MGAATVLADLKSIEAELDGAPDRVLQPEDLAACVDLGERVEALAERLLVTRPAPGLLWPSPEQDRMVVTGEDRQAIRRFQEISRSAH